MLTRISRILVGALFIVSGLIKANDPIGFSYKLHDYFAPGVFNMPTLDPIALELSVFICVAEIVLGLAILFAAQMRLAAWSLLVLMVFFTFLTGYTAVANWFFDNPEAGLTSFFEGLIGFVAREDISYMKDCGCFGDAIKLDPWESFCKDIVLLVFTLIIFRHRNTIQPSEDWITDAINLGVALVLIAAFSIGFVSWTFPVWFAVVAFVLLMVVKRVLRHSSRDWIMASGAALLSLGFSIHCINHLPIKDFRPYKIGNNIAELKTCPPGAPQDVYEDKWFYRVNGVVGEYTTEQAPWNLEGAEFVDRKTKLISKGCEPPIHDFVLEDEYGSDLTDELLTEEAILLVITHDVTKASAFHINTIAKLTEAVQSDGIYVYGLAANTRSEIEDFRHAHQLMFDYLTADGTMLKTIIRSNPGLVLLQRGTVRGKWHHRDVPSAEQLRTLLQ